MKKEPLPFTRGPWIAKRNPHGMRSNAWVIRPANASALPSDWIADVGDCDVEKERLGNAQLMAYAPEMLEIIERSYYAIRVLRKMCESANLQKGVKAASDLESTINDALSKIGR